MGDRHPVAGHLPSCRHPTGWQPPGEGASPGRKMPDGKRPDGPEWKPSFLFPPLSVSWRWRVSRVSAVRASPASAAAPSLTLTWRVLSRRGVAARHLPSPPLPSPRAGPRLRTRVPVPGRAGGVVPAVAFRSRGRARHVLRGLRVCMRVQSTALPPRSPRPWATPVLCSRGRGLGGRPGARLCVPTVPSGACWRVASLVGSHPGGSCVLQADQ